MLPPAAMPCSVGMRSKGQSYAAAMLAGEEAAWPLESAAGPSRDVTARKRQYLEGGRGNLS
jgi:hypothetical protein